MPLFKSKRKDDTPEAGPESQTFIGDPQRAIPSSLSPNTDHPSTEDKFKAANTKLGEAESSYEKYSGARPTQALNKSDDMLNTVQSVADTDLYKAVQHGVNTLMDRMPALLRALDEVARIHPFISVAVGAFKVVVELDLKRRDNDKKIRALLLEMRDMMAALLQLRDIKDEDTLGMDGVTIEGRMQHLVETTAKDIENCGNACDTYSKKHLFVKVVKSGSWDDKLTTFIGTFSKRREDFILALSMHSAAVGDDTNRQIVSLHNKMDVMFEFFKNAVSAEHLDLAARVKRCGNLDDAIKDDNLLKGLAQTTDATTPAAKRSIHASSDARRLAETTELEEIREGLRESPDDAMQKNLAQFERKFQVQLQDLQDALELTIIRSTDRVIKAFTSGPHNRILDKVIYSIWKEMQWRGNVKARHFVLALRDYYREARDEKRKAKNGELAPMPAPASDGEEADSHDGERMAKTLPDEDEWALEYINVNRLQAIIEAFDDDASGLITVTEVNLFTASRPKDWSLPHWLAYWAVGWQMTATYYRDKIVELTAKMFSIRPQILPANRSKVDWYLGLTWRGIVELTVSLDRNTQTDDLRGRFRSYVDSEENRLRQKLEAVKYDIDAMDTLLLVTGPGRVEKYLYPLLYLLLRRDFEIFRIARTQVIHEDELSDSADTIAWVFDAVDDRCNDLQDLFKQQRLDPAQQFQGFACEMFKIWRDNTEFWSLNSMKQRTFEEIEYVDENEDQNVDWGGILNYALVTGGPPSISDDDEESDGDEEPDGIDKESDDGEESDDDEGRPGDAICDGCNSIIRGTRLICMQCGQWDTFDFHDKEPCWSSTVDTRDDITPPHRPTHDMLKLRRSIIHAREVGAILRNSTSALERACKLLNSEDKSQLRDSRPILTQVGVYRDGQSAPDTEVDEYEDEPNMAEAESGLGNTEAAAQVGLGRSEHGDDEEMGPSAYSRAGTAKLVCVCRRGDISQPCFFCVDCMSAGCDVFICADCDMSSDGLESSIGNHEHSHTLVRCLESPFAAEESGNDSTDTRLKTLETVMSISSTVSAFEGKLVGLEGYLTGLNDRISGIERVLEALLSKCS